MVITEASLGQHFKFNKNAVIFIPRLILHNLLSSTQLELHPITSGIIYKMQPNLQLMRFNHETPDTILFQICIPFANIYFFEGKL